MSVLIINGSPRADGTVARILHIIEAEAERRGCTAAFIDAASLSFASCTGCMACRSNGACVLPHDDAHDIAEQVRQCDAIAVGTPVYWGGMSGDLKRLFDRLVYVLMDESPLGIPVPLHKGKRAVIAAACTTPFPFNIICGQTSGAFGALREILSSAGFAVKRRIAVPGTKGTDKLTFRRERQAKKCAEAFAAKAGVRRFGFCGRKMR